ncbi:MAG: triple tyrosine motif-containing protein, partial [Bacteroidia bacterium]
MSEDAEGNIWAGTENGLCKYNEQTNKWKRYVNIPGNQKSLHNNSVRSLCLDKKGTLWIGTNGGGLNRYNKEQDNFTHFTMKDGLINDQIYTLVCDNNGMLWMGTNHGLCRFNPTDYSCKNFTEKDGIQNYEYNTGAALKLKDGTLLIGGISGYNIIDPNRIENKKPFTPVVISSFKVMDKETPTGNNNITLSYKENNLSFEFAALSYFRNQENHYAYQLEGVDRDWVYSDTRRYISYSQLKPGTYTFRVKAANHDGVWNETGAQMVISIKPPFWQTWWFIILCLTVFSGILYLINRYELNRVKQLAAVRERISRDLHD